MVSEPAWLSAVLALEERSVELLGAVGREWGELCGDNVRHAVGAWGLQHIEPLSGGRGGLVLLARLSDGLPVVLKAPIVDPSLHIAAQMELAAAGVGPRVLATDLPRGLLLLEYIEFGRLTRPTPPAERNLVVEALAGLHAHQSGHSFPRITDWLSSRLVGIPADRAPTARPVSEQQQTAARLVLEELSCQDETVFIHADLNVGNILCEVSRGTALLDARGVFGDPAYDYALLAVKTSDPYCAVRPLEELAAGLAAKAGYDKARAAAWVTVILAAMV